MSAPCRHGNPLSEHCWECDSDIVRAAVRAERERVLGLIEADLERWRAHIDHWEPKVGETVMLCADQIEFTIARIRKGEP